MGCEAYVTAVRKSKAIEMRYADIRAFLLHPHICPDLAADLLVHGAGMLGLGELVRHGAAEHDLPGPCPGLDVHQDADVEAASDPCVALQNGASVASAQPKVLSGHSLD